MVNHKNLDRPDDPEDNYAFVSTVPSPLECLECGKEIEEGMVYCDNCEKWLDKHGFFED